MLIAGNRFVDPDIARDTLPFRELLIDILSEMLAVSYEASVIAEACPPSVDLDAQAVRSIEEIGDDITQLLLRLGH